MNDLSLTKSEISARDAAARLGVNVNHLVHRHHGSKPVVQYGGEYRQGFTLAALRDATPTHAKQLDRMHPSYVDFTHPYVRHLLALRTGRAEAGEYVFEGADEDAVLDADAVEQLTGLSMGGKGHYRGTIKPSATGTHIYALDKERVKAMCAAEDRDFVERMMGLQVVPRVTDYNAPLAEELALAEEARVIQRTLGSD